MVRPITHFGLPNSTRPQQDPLNTLRGLWSQSRQIRNGFTAWQPRSVVPTYWTQPEMREFFSESNRQFLKQQVYERFNGIIGDDVLLRQMSENGAQWYLTMYTEETYGPSDSAQRRRALAMMNDRTIHRIGQLYAAQRGVTSLHLQYAHQGPTMNWEQPEYERTADYSFEIERN
jgi:hypothetical protein